MFFRGLVTRADLDIDLRMFRREFFQARYEILTGEKRLHGNAYGTAYGARFVAGNDSVQLIDERTNICIKQLAGFSEASRAATTFKEWLTKLLFEALDLVADGGCSDKKLLTRSAKAPISCSNAERSQSAQRKFRCPDHCRLPEHLLRCPIDIENTPMFFGAERHVWITLPWFVEGLEEKHCYVRIRRPVL